MEKIRESISRPNVYLFKLGRRGVAIADIYWGMATALVKVEKFINAGYAAKEFTIVDNND